MASGTHIAIPEELFEVSESSTFSGTLELAELEVGPDRYRFSAPLPWTVLIVNTGEGSLLVSGSITGVATVDCGRCLDELRWDFQGEVEGVVLLSDPGEAVSEDLDEDEYVVLDASRELELLDFLLAALRLDAPLMPLCREDCRSLCPECGANLNDGSCPCDAADKEPDPDFERQNNPFAALKDFKFDN